MKRETRIDLRALRADELHMARLVAAARERMDHEAHHRAQALAVGRWSRVAVSIAATALVLLGVSRDWQPAPVLAVGVRVPDAISPWLAQRQPLNGGALEEVLVALGQEGRP